MTILPGQVAVLNYFNGTPIEYDLSLSQWDQAATALVENKMLVRDNKRRTYVLTDLGRNLLKILQKQEDLDIARRKEEQAKKKEAAQSKIDVITELVTAMDPDARLLLFRHLEETFCFTSGANR